MDMSTTLQTDRIERSVVVAAPRDRVWRAQCAGKVSGWAMLAGHFIPEELPEETARALGEFFGG